MRYLVIILVAANLAFYFLYPRPPATIGHAHQNPSGIPGAEQLVMLAEQPAETVTEVESPPALQTGNTEVISPVTEDPRADRLAVADTEVRAENVLDQESQESQPGAMVTETGDAGQVGQVGALPPVAVQTGVVAIEDESVQDSSDLRQVPTTQETGEVTDFGEPVADAALSPIDPNRVDTQIPSSPAEQVTVTEFVPEPVPDPVCYSIGPFLVEKEAAAVAAQLVDSGYAVSERADTVRQPSDYWVYLSAMPKQDARRIVADLKARGIKDYFVGKQHYISLGIFSRKSQALRRQKQIIGLGYDAVLERRFRDQAVRWLDVRDEENMLAGSGLWTGFREKYLDVELKAAGCE